jgi:hypothetical protein
MSPFRPNPLTPFPAREGGKFGEVLPAGGEVNPKTLANHQPTGVGKRGFRGRKPPGGGPWGVSPHKTKRGGESPTLTNPPRVGPKPLANPKPTRVGKWGVQGREAPMAGGVGGAPHKFKRGGRIATLATTPRARPKTLANPRPTGVGKGGSRGAKPPWRGVWGCPPQIQKKGRIATLATPPRVGPKTLANPQPTRVGNWGWRGRSPLPRGLGDVPPK